MKANNIKTKDNHSTYWRLWTMNEPSAQSRTMKFPKLISTAISPPYTIPHTPVKPSDNLYHNILWFETTTALPYTYLIGYECAFTMHNDQWIVMFRHLWLRPHRFDSATEFGLLCMVVRFMLLPTMNRSALAIQYILLIWNQVTMNYKDKLI